MHLIAWSNAVAVYWNDWWQFFAFLGLGYFCIWNVYAYPRNRNMRAIPSTPINVTRNGLKEDRHLLFVTSLGLFVILNLIWIVKHFKIIQ